MVFGQSGSEVNGLIATRRSFLLLPALGLATRSSEINPRPPFRLPLTRILLGGDVMLSRHVGAIARKRSDPAWPFRDVARLFSSADIAFANLEAPFSDRGRLVTEGMVFKAEPEMIEGLLLAGVDVVSTANNHARDCGAHGIEFTLDWLAANGIAAVGTGHTAEAAHEGVIVSRNGIRFGFLAYTYDQSNGNYRDQDDRIATMDVAAMTHDVKDLRERADVVIVSMHAGWEYQRQPNSLQQKFARAAIDAGANIVVGHHPHVAQAVEQYSSGLIFYSLGNLIFDQFQRPDTQVGLIADLRFLAGELVGYGLIPVDIVRTAPRVRKAESIQQPANSHRLSAFSRPIVGG